ncbi:MAG: preprotein translocase subunit SecE [Planctomycetota bacterium]|jgi:preprotein translocase subunit SecE
MSQASSSAVLEETGHGGGSSGGSGGSGGGGGGGGDGRGGGSGSGGPSGSQQPNGGIFQQYKRDQGKWTRLGTFVGLMALTAWCAKFFYDELQTVENIVFSTGIPVVILVIFGALSWWVTYSNRKSSDFMIATEGEMKKVSWSSRNEVIGSTKVVIVFTLLMAMALFMVDLLFGQLFQWLGVLKVSG